MAMNAVGLLTLGSISTSDLSAVYADLGVVVTNIDPRAMACSFTLTNLLSGATTSPPGFNVGGTQRSRLDLDLSQMTIAKNQLVRVTITLSDPYALFISGSGYAITAGDTTTQSQIMFAPSTGVFVSSQTVQFYCKWIGGDVSPTLRSYNVGIVALDSGGNSDFQLQTYFDPKIKNDG
jgi:hypothetical protein